MSKSLPEFADILDKAADHIDTVGWFQGSLYNDFTDPDKPLAACQVCALGAINMALHGTPQFPLRGHEIRYEAHEVAELLKSRIGDDELAEWNDAEGRTQAEVTALMRETAAELRGGAA
ncbi:DUF6197 family protein [Streptomyces prunicolor]